MLIQDKKFSELFLVENLRRCDRHQGILGSEAFTYIAQFKKQTQFGHKLGMSLLAEAFDAGLVGIQSFGFNDLIQVFYVIRSYARFFSNCGKQLPRVVRLELYQCPVGGCQKPHIKLKGLPNTLILSYS